MAEKPANVHGMEVDQPAMLWENHDDDHEHERRRHGEDHRRARHRPRVRRRRGGARGDVFHAGGVFAGCNLALLR